MGDSRRDARARAGAPDVRDGPARRLDRRRWRPATVMIDIREERPRLRTESRGMRADAAGRVLQDRRDVVVRE
jgi:hypothetical protein